MICLVFKGFQMTNERFLGKMKINQETGCWEWEGGKNKKGYGQFWTKGDDRKKWLAHRHSYELHRGPIPDGMMVCHSCDNRACINPNHLFIGTAADNTADMMSKGREKIPRIRGSVHGRAKLAEEDVLAIRAASGISLQSLADQYNVTKQNIWFIRRRKGWNHV